MRNAARTFRLDRVRGQIVVKETGELIDKHNILDLVSSNAKTSLKEPQKEYIEPVKKLVSHPITNIASKTTLHQHTDLNKGSGTGWKVVGWIFGLLFLVSSPGGILNGEWLVAISVAIAGVIIIPPINSVIATKLKEKGIIKRFSIAKAFCGGWLFIVLINLSFSG